jgi:2-polyprenyl-3-methyl-5-hydroxy-6-metoxy-1,4-benzoquinol methylase
VTGIDAVETALRVARKRTAEAGVAVTFLCGDDTRLI